MNDESPSDESSNKEQKQEAGSQASDHGVREHQAISHDGTPAQASPESGARDPKDFTFNFQALKKSSGVPSAVCALFNTNESHTPLAVLSVECSGQVLVADVRTNTPYNLLKITPPFERLSFNRHTGRLAVSSGPFITIFDLASVAPSSSADQPKDLTPTTYELKRLQTQISSLEFEPNGEALLIGGVDGKLYRWRFIEEQRAKTLSQRERSFERYVGLASVVSVVRYHPLGRVFFSGDWLGTLGAWQAYDADSFGGLYIENLFGNRYFMQKAVRTSVTLADASAVDQLEINANGELLLSASQKGKLEIWRVRGMMKLGEVQGHDGAVAALAFSADGKAAASLGRDGKLRRWEIIAHDNEYQPNGDPVEYELNQKKEFEVPQGRALISLDDGSFLAATATGQLYQME